MIVAMTVHDPPYFPLGGPRPTMEVSQRFAQFLTNITLTDPQRADGATKRSSVCAVLNQKYYGTSSGSDNSIYVGSWGKETR